MFRIPLRPARIGVVLSVVLMMIAASAALGGQAPTPAKATPVRHVVGVVEMRASAAAAASVREARIEKIAGVLKTDGARAQMTRLGLRPEQAVAAVSRLDDADLAYLAARSEGIMAGIEGGGSNLWLLAGIGAAVVLGICVYLLATTEY